MSGRFIVFEGPDGCGKSTMLAAARGRLAGLGIDAVFVRDPGGTAIGQQIRQLLLATDNSGMAAMTELLLYIASRAQLVAQVIRPALAQGRTVISDRFTPSTLVYQGVAGVLPEERLREVVQLGAAGVTPDHVILLDVPAEVGLGRVTRPHDRMEGKGLAFHQAVRERYLRLAAEPGPETYHLVDAAAAVECVRDRVMEILDAVLS